MPKEYKGFFQFIYREIIEGVQRHKYWVIYKPLHLSR